MLGSFSLEALEAYTQAVINNSPSIDFSEGGTYDFTRCVRSDGSAYGTGGRCRSGTEEAKASEDKKPRAKKASAEKEKKAPDPHQIAKWLKKDNPNQTAVKLNKEDGSAAIAVRGDGNISSNRVIEDHFRRFGQPYGYTHNKVEKFTDEHGNQHKITPLEDGGKIWGYSIKITPKQG